MKDNAQTLGFAEAESAYLLAYLGILNTIGRLISGWLSDRPWANVILINNVSLVLSGIATAFVPVLRTYAALLAYACCFGFIISAFIAVRTILIVEVLGLDRLTNAYGFMLLFQGFAIIAAPPLLGSFYDVFRNFNFTFIFGGVALFVSGLLCFPLAAVARWERRKELTGTGADDAENEDDFLPSDSTGLMRIIRKLRDRCVKRCCCRQTRVGYDPTELVQNDIDIRIDQMPGVQ
ncbi:hypothetical protein PHET_04674 [Paragonimus heterotremus]|uniref:Major facilitator superfamily (MFS) profile domain-containing protein n=1 Tax=Paragonimus heterotremus TaxID=100268 RepID=A0A8J4SQ82_9TREM|nr:hypothetical protein PHET_04674 [Paragonimus heterotremus]